MKSEILQEQVQQKPLRLLTVLCTPPFARLLLFFFNDIQIGAVVPLGALAGIIAGAAEQGLQ